MNYAAILEAADSLSLKDRIRLVDVLARSIEAEQDEWVLTDEFRQELDRRIADMDANPGDEIPWEQARAEILAKLRQDRGEIQ